jgi:molybdate transport system substrate-binding protein
MHLLRYLKLRLAVAIAVPVTFAAGWCDTGVAETPPTSGVASSVTIFAASSLKNVLDAAGKATQDAGKLKLVVALASSSALAKQIEQGAPADVFISADADWMDYLVGKDLVRANTRTVVATNTLVLIAPRSSQTQVILTPGVDLASILGDGRLAVADVKAVPAGKYAKAALQNMGAWAGVENKLAPAENVRAALALVSRAEAPLGIVYASDANADPTVRIVATFPANSHPAIVYPAAVTKAAASPDAAAAFIAFLKSSQGAELFAAHGFGPAQ